MMVTEITHTGEANLLYYLGLSFVALSRASSLQHLLIPFPFDRISRHGDLPSMIQRKREENCMRQ